jgi:signal transduction histidine kinase
MPFRVSARTLLHLGAELISSDATAFYELIKNGLDAGSRLVEIDVVVRIPYPEHAVLLDQVAAEDEGWEQEGDDDGDAFERARDAVMRAVDRSAPEAASFRKAIGSAEEWEDLARLLDEANYITVADTGSGMSLRELTDVYLTIGTPSRLKDREEWRKAASDGGGARARPVLGEKGVGRLSVMRLGERLEVTTAREQDTRWNLLEIDWGRFSADPEAMIGEIEILPEKGPKKENAGDAGTTLRITRLTSAWSLAKLEDISRRQFSKLADPFASSRLPVKLRYNAKPVEIPRFNRILFEHAHATVEATFSTAGKPRLAGKIQYSGKNQPAPGSARVGVFEAEGAHLVSIAGGMLPGEEVTAGTLCALGPFKLTVYWYNRRILTAIEGIGNQRAVRELLAEWAGGVMVYRDGFRVMPYGSPDDDWLNMDRRALASRAYKVNRAQIVGKLDISAITNPRLVDQTNREGLRESVEKRVLVRLLKWILETQLLEFLDRVDKERLAADSVGIDTLEERVESQDSRLKEALRRLVADYPDAERKHHVRTLVEESRETIQTVLNEVRQQLAAYETGRTQLVHLAGIGLMVEILAHELNRATSHTLRTLSDLEARAGPAETSRLLTMLEAQLRTLQKRLRTLDPLSTRGRQVKEKFDLTEWVHEILDAHRAQFRRHGIRLRFNVRPQPGSPMVIRAVRGMILQVIENLISNSVYWLKQQRKLDPGFEPEIAVVVDVDRRQVRFSDNGPGIEPARSELVFRAFHSTKPPGAGNGLGLYIAREIADYNDAVLYLDPKPERGRHTLNTFIFDLQPSEERTIYSEEA